MTQMIFEWISQKLGSAPLQIHTFITKLENGYCKLSFTNYFLNEPTLKAIAVLIPWLVNVEEVEFNNIKISDHLATSILMGVFMNPTIKTLKL